MIEFTFFITALVAVVFLLGMGYWLKKALLPIVASIILFMLGVFMVDGIEFAQEWQVSEVTSVVDGNVTTVAYQYGLQGQIANNTFTHGLEILFFGLALFFFYDVVGNVFRESKKDDEEF